MRTTSDYPSLDQRRELCETRVTLNGQPAVIRGAECDFPQVTQLGTGLGAEWSWPAVARIVANGGQFKS